MPHIPPKQFLIDGDSTIWMHDFPFIEREVPHAVRVIKRIQDAGHTLILCTMRADEDLDLAKSWLKDHDLHFDYFNHNPTMETGSRKIYGHWHIDDHNLGTPLIFNPMIHRKPYIDWQAMEKILEDKGLI